MVKVSGVQCPKHVNTKARHEGKRKPCLNTNNEWRERMLRRMLSLAACVGLGMSLAACKQKAGGTENASGSEAATAPKKLTIAVIPKGETHVFWQTVKGGAMKAGQDLDVDIKWKGPMTENDRAQQIQVVNDFINISTTLWKFILNNTLDNIHSIK